MMKSPFPGMDPYLESRWPEVHASLIVYARNQINLQLPDDLQANIEENLTVLSEDDQSTIRPDANVSQQGISHDSPRPLATATLSEPLRLKRPPHPSRHIEIRSARGKVITAIEFLSPWNKVGSRARDLYLRKQLDYLNASVNLVEIDLVRQGGYVLNAPLEELPESMRTPYMACVTHSVTPDEVELYRAPIDKPLPTIPVPLRPGESDVVLTLQSLLDDCYRDGRYHRISYQENPPVSFADNDSKWIDTHLRQQGRRV